MPAALFVELAYRRQSRSPPWWTMISFKNFSWTNDDQNMVADYIANKGMSPAEAAQKWIDENEATWKAWMP